MTVVAKAARSRHTRVTPFSLRWCHGRERSNEGGDSVGRGDAGRRADAASAGWREAVRLGRTVARGAARRGPVTLRLRDLERLRAALAEHPELAEVLRLGSD